MNDPRMPKPYPMRPWTSPVRLSGAFFRKRLRPRPSTWPPRALKAPRLRARAGFEPPTETPRKTSPFLVDPPWAVGYIPQSMAHHNKNKRPRRRGKRAIQTPLAQASPSTEHSPPAQEAALPCPGQSMPASERDFVLFQLSAPSARPQTPQRALLLGATIIFPLATIANLEWADRTQAFGSPWLWLCAASAPILALRWSFHQPGWRSAAKAFGFACSASVHAACLLLWIAAISSLPREARLQGGEVVALQCFGARCEFGLFDHGANVHRAYGAPAERAPEIGQALTACFKPSFLGPVRMPLFMPDCSGSTAPDPSEPLGLSARRPR